MAEPKFYPVCVLDGKIHHNVFIRTVKTTYEKAQAKGLHFAIHDDGLCHALVHSARHGFADEYLDICWEQPVATDVVEDSDRYAISFDYEDD